MVDFHLYVVLRVANIIYFDNDKLELNVDCDQLFHKFIHLERVLDLRPTSQFSSPPSSRPTQFSATGPELGRSVLWRENQFSSENFPAVSQDVGQEVRRRREPMD